MAGSSTQWCDRLAISAHANGSPACPASSMRARLAACPPARSSHSAARRARSRGASADRGSPRPGRGAPAAAGQRRPRFTSSRPWRSRVSTSTNAAAVRVLVDPQPGEPQRRCPWPPRPLRPRRPVGRVEPLPARAQVALDGQRSPRPAVSAGCRRGPRGTVATGSRRPPALRAVDGHPGRCAPQGPRAAPRWAAVPIQTPRAKFSSSDVALVAGGNRGVAAPVGAHCGTSR
jgi:hypothetical protein